MRDRSDDEDETDDEGDAAESAPPLASPSEYYFLPLGRVRGDLFDLLKLPSDATEDIVRNARGDYKRQTKQEFNTAFKQLNDAQNQPTDNDSLPKGRLSKEEMAARKKQLEEKKQASDEKLNELAKVYDARMAERRKLQKSGLVVDETIWEDDCVRLFQGGDAGWARITAARPLPKLPDRFLSEVLAHCVLNAEATPETWNGLCERMTRNPEHFWKFNDGAAKKSATVRTMPPATVLPSARVGSAGTALSVEQLHALTVEQDMTMLLAADLLWKHLPGTNRARWRDFVREFDVQLQTQAARLDANVEKKRSTEKPLYPALSTPTPLAIKRLRSKDTIAKKDH